jgi:hypothetical protein
VYSESGERESTQRKRESGESGEREREWREWTERQRERQRERECILTICDLSLREKERQSRHCSPQNKTNVLSKEIEDRVSKRERERQSERAGETGT